MTCNTSAVAVCCSKASRVSVKSRAFSIAMTACAAKFCNSAICLLGEGTDLLTINHENAEEDIILHQWRRKPGSCPTEVDRGDTYRIAQVISVLCCEIRYMDEACPINDTTQTSLPTWPQRLARQKLGKWQRHSPQRESFKLLAIVGHEVAEGCLAQPHRLVEHRIKDRREVAGRGIDDLQYLGGGGLLLQGLARLRDEPRIFDGNHRLCSEILQQCNLLV